MAEILPIQAMKLPALLPVQAMKLAALLTIQAVKLPALPTPPPQDQNDTYVYGIGIIAVLAIEVCIFFAYNTFQPKNPVNKKQDQPPKQRHML